MNDAPASNGGPHMAAHFILDPRPGGPHTFVTTLQRSGELPPGPIVTAGRGPVTGIALTNLRHLWKWAYPLEALLNTLRICLLRLTGPLKGRGTVFHVHGAANVAPLLAARLTRTPAVWHLHETDPSQRALAALGRALMFPRTPVAAVTGLAASALNVPVREVIPPPVDTAFWRPDANGVPRHAVGPAHIVAVGNLNPLKGQDVLVEAMRRVPGPWSLELVGERLANQPGYARAVETAARDLTTGREGCAVSLPGRLDAEAIRARLAASDLFVLPSRSEGCPIALLEAMAMGCVCVATSVGGVPELIEDGVTGWLAAPEDPAGLAEAIVKALGQAEAQRATMGRRARERVQTDHAPGTVAARVMNLYRQTLETAKTQ